MEDLEKKFYIFPHVEIAIDDFANDGYILDIGGGGEGVIGQLKGREVVAVDTRREELEEAPPGPLKIVMNARDLLFLDDSFATVTAFFTLMYVQQQEDQETILREAWRVLKPGGAFHIWDLNLAELPRTDKEFFLVHLSYRIRGGLKETGYGSRWPDKPRGTDYYLTMATDFGFQQTSIKRIQHTFYAKLVKT